MIFSNGKFTQLIPIIRLVFFKNISPPTMNYFKKEILNSENMSTDIKQITEKMIVHVLIKK